MLNKKDNNGFTLVEIMVVLILISLMLFFTVPRIQSSIFSGDEKDVTRWLILKTKSLKESALIEQRAYILHINIDTDRLFISHEAMTEEEIAKAKENEFVFPKSMEVMDVEYPGAAPIINGEVEIYFYPKGYSDKAIIHVADGDNEYRSYVVEPFLSKLKIIDHYYRYES